MDNITLTQLIQDVKNHLDENEGEFVYSGEPIQRPRPNAEAATDERGAPGSVAATTALSKPAALEALYRQEIGDCHRCPLGETRIKLVFGVGNPDAPVMFVGEGPGFDEDRKGEPFVGKAGQLLDKILAAIGLDRTNVYIANVVKCHPMIDASQPDKRSNDRPPSPEEMEKCLPFLKAQIGIVNPSVIVTLGATATKALLKTSRGISAIRGQLFDLTLDDGRVVPVLPTFHPAALLRDETLKKPVWEDMKKLRGLLEA